MALVSGTKLGPYEVLSFLGAGRFVWINSGAPFSRIAEFFDGLLEESRFISLLNRLQLPI